jgi:hypothetical protein
MIATFRRLRGEALKPRRPIPTSEFDNWYIHCPKCQKLLVLLMGGTGPRWQCGCSERGAGSR